MYIFVHIINITEVGVHTTQTLRLWTVRGEVYFKYMFVRNINITEARSTLLSMYWEGRGVTDLNYPDIAAIARLPKEVYEYGPLAWQDFNLEFKRFLKFNWKIINSTAIFFN